MLTLLNFNIGDYDDKPVLELAYFLRDAKADIIGLHEVSWAHNAKKLSLLKEALGLPYSLVSASSGRHSHTVLLSKYPISPVKDLDTFVNSGVISVVTAPHLSFCLAAIHLDPSSEQRRLDEVMQVLEAAKHTNAPTIIMGDFNAITESEPVEYAGVLNEPVQYDVTNMLRSAGFIDTGRQKEQPFIPTVPVTRDGDVTYQNLRLDYIFIDEVLSRHSYEYGVGVSSTRPNFSDHIPITLTFN